MFDDDDNDDDDDDDCDDQTVIARKRIRVRRGKRVHGEKPKLSATIRVLVCLRYPR